MRFILLGARRWRLMAVVSLLFATGCGGGQGLPPEADADKARQALTVGLDAWKNGQQSDELKSQNPPIYFTDLAWQAGQRLEKYEIGDTMDRSGQSVVASVALTLRNREGTMVQKKVQYLIDTSPAVVIVPGDPVGKNE